MERRPGYEHLAAGGRTQMLPTIYRDYTKVKSIININDTEMS